MALVYTGKLSSDRLPFGNEDIQYIRYWSDLRNLRGLRETPVPNLR